MRFRTVSLLLLFMPVLGCEGRTTTDTLPWSCNESCEKCPAVSRPASLVGFWRFDDETLGGQWQSASGTALGWVACADKAGGDWVAGDAWSGLCGTERLGGVGGSLRLQADGYVEAQLPENLAAEPLTLAAWVSLLRSTTDRMTVMSVVRPACQSVWMDVSESDGLRNLSVSVERADRTDEQCLVGEWTASLPSGFFDWGLGNWYHVAAEIGVDGVPALFVDGAAVSTTASGEQYSSAARAGSSLIIGADPGGGQPYKGLIDDVALFSQALTADELSGFVLDSTSVRSDGQTWMPWSADGSTASWDSDCREPSASKTTGGATVVVDNGYWSAGGLVARVDQGQLIGTLRKATLVADIPDQESFDFVLASPHNAERCAWNATGAGQHRYEFTLDDVNNCDCPSACGCNFGVAEARVGTRWDEDGKLQFTACRVEFEWDASGEEPGLELGPGPGGMLGLNGWCWRPVTYHPSASVELDEERTNAEMTAGTLRGGNRVTAYLAADFAVGAPNEAHRLCDLSQVTQITIEAAMPEGFSYQLRVADYTGIAHEWSRQWDPDQPVQEFTLCEEAGSEAECGRDVDPIPSKLRSVDLHRIRYLGIQKTFELSADEGEIELDRIEFAGVPVGSCIIGGDPGVEAPQ